MKTKYSQSQKFTPEEQVWYDDARDIVKNKDMASLRKTIETIPKGLKQHIYIVALLDCIELLSNPYKHNLKKEFD